MKEKWELWEDVFTMFLTSSRVVLKEINANKFTDLLSHPRLHHDLFFLFVTFLGV